MGSYAVIFIYEDEDNAVYLFDTQEQADDFRIANEKISEAQIFTARVHL